MFDDLNPGIVIGGAAAAISIFAALAALYLWAVNRTGRKLGPTVDPHSRVIAQWLVPLLLPTFIILCLGMIANLWKAFEQRSWPEASTLVFTAWPAFCILTLWMKIRKKPRSAHATEEQ